MKFFKRSVFALLLSACMCGTVWGEDYGLPSGIQEGNILHCFNWSINQVKEELPNIAAAGFGSVQLSPLQRADIRAGEGWHALYRPYDMAFKASSFMGSEDDLKALCQEAEKYGIKVIVDVVANHVDKTNGYHDTWWDSNGRVRWEGGIDYGNRNSITHGQLGDYGDINSELQEVCDRGKAYVEKLKSLGVKGCRWDAAKHIGLPSEGCNFWSSVTSVPGMYHYGEILDAPGPNAGIIKEYAQYMSVTDNRYSNGAARENGGIPGGYGGDWVVNQGLSDTKVVYWGESHDTYANDEWSQNVDQSVIDRAYASYACRNGATALYLARPNAKGFNNIKVGKGSTAFKNKHIAEVNKFRNLMTGRADWCEAAGNTFTVTRKDGGAVIVSKGSGNVSVVNGGGYCPAGTYTDRVSGGTFTVTATTISGNVGSSGIAVLVKEGVGPDPNPNPNPDPDPNPNPNPDDFSSLPQINGVYLKNTSNWSQPYVWAWSDGGNSTASGTWPGDQMTRSGDYWKWEIPAGKGEPTQLIFNPGSDNGKTGDLQYVKSGVYDCSGTKLGVAGGSNPNPNPDPNPDPNPGDFTIYYDNSESNWSTVNIHYWSNPHTDWPGVSMTKVEGNVWKYTFTENPSTVEGFLFHNNSGDQTADYKHAPIANHIYKGKGGKGEVTDGGVYSNHGDDPQKPVVTASPASGTRFDESVTVTLTVAPAATIYYTVNGSTPDASSSKYTSALTFTETTTLKTYAVTSEGASNVQTFTYSKRGVNPDPQPTNNLITDYYKVNPDGKVGSRKTISMSGHPATSALSNWTEDELIAQGVARDVAQAYKGLHERPIVDSYALYAAYDNDNLYLGVQFVYTVWDLYGEGKQPGESKPYNMDGHMMWAFDLDPDKSFTGYIDGTGPIWNEKQKGAKFNNGVDAVLMCSTKPGTGTPGLFIPTPDGNASYDAAYCKGLPAGFYGYTDGLLPSITKIWGLPFGSDPEDLKGNDGFVDLRGEIDDTAHTFYEFEIPLSVLGVTADYIASNGIGVMYCDKYGTSPVGGTPYDPSYFDNVKEEYSYGDNTSKEKEDEDIITYAPARIGKMSTNTAVETIVTDNNATPEYYNLQGVRVMNPSNGIYIVRRGNKVTKEVVR